jgi:hypothetical protein
LTNLEIKAPDSQGFDTARLAEIEPVAYGLGAVDISASSHLSVRQQRLRVAYLG